jgi:hypothetical protein
MAEVFSAQQPSGNGEAMVTVSFFQGLVNKMAEIDHSRKEAIEIVDYLKNWLLSQQERDMNFSRKLVTAIEDNTQQIEGGLADDDIAKIASKFAPQTNGGDTADAF